MRKRKSQKPRQLNSSDEEQATHATDVSEAEGTKVLQNLETLAKEYEKKSNRPRTSSPKLIAPPVFENKKKNHRYFEI